MRIAYYARSATREFWSEHWGGESPRALARIAEVSPLTDAVLAHVPVGARVLEAGCGLGQYVVLLRRRGRRTVGVDWSPAPLATCRAWTPGTPLAAMDLRSLAFRDRAFDAYVSLGVVEHDPDGPDAILEEARRVLVPGGRLVLSVPYVNGVRWLGRWWIRRRNRRVQAFGGQFYQFALSGREVARVLERHGFSVVSATPYDPARILRSAWRRLGQRLGLAASGPTVRTAGSAAPGATTADGALGGDRAAAMGHAARLARRVLYTRPVLHAFGHMILFAAVRR